MPRRLGINATLWSYRYLALRDGERCQLCGAVPIPATQNPRDFAFPVTQYPLERDHRDGDRFNEEPENLRLLCKKCNIGERNKASCAPRGDSARNEKARTSAPVASRIVKAVVDYSHPEAPATMQAAAQFEDAYKEWVCKQVREHGYYPEQDAIYGGSAATGCAPSTARNYLWQLLSSVGPLKRQKDKLGGWMLTFKDGSRQAAFALQDDRQAEEVLEHVF